MSSAVLTRRLRVRVPGSAPKSTGLVPARARGTGYGGAPSAVRQWNPAPNSQGGEEMDFHEQMAAFDARRGKMTTFDPT